MDVESCVFDEILDELILEEAFDFHYTLKKKLITVDEIYNVFPIPSKSDLEEERQNQSNDLGIGKVQSAPNMLVQCPVCNESVGAVRFAPHLEKCLRGGKRGNRDTKSSLFDVGLQYATKVKAVPKDPHPESLVIRIKTKNGVPKPNQIRIGVAMEEWLQNKPVVGDDQNAKVDNKEASS
jgi:hypothetical protein